MYWTPYERPSYTRALEFLELEFNGNTTNTDRPALRSSVDSGLALNAHCLWNNYHQLFLV
jgi:hypothetical protein